MTQKILSLLFIFIMLVSNYNCAQMFSTKKTDNKKGVYASLLYLSLKKDAPVCISTSSISGFSSTRTKFSPTASGCSNDLGSGVTGSQVSVGSGAIYGTSASSVLKSSTGLSGIKSNIEVSFTLASGGSLDIIFYSSNSSNGPGFRVSNSSVQGLNNSGTAQALDIGGSVSASTTKKTYCFEIHSENSGSTAHLIGWDRACAEVTDRGTYTFEKELTSGVSFLGYGFGFVLNNATIHDFTITPAAVGTAANVQNGN